MVLINPEKARQSRSWVSRVLRPKHGRNDGQGQPGWRPTLIAWTWAVLTIFVLNVCFLVWASVQASPPLPQTATGSPLPENTQVLFFGDCAMASRIKSWVHVVVNIFSSLLLMASATCMQCLGSLTRGEIDKAHAKGISVDIGVQSGRNFLFIAPQRKTAWIALALSSFPLHLFYNSVMVQSLGTRDVLTTFTNLNFLTSHELNTTALAAIGLNSSSDLGNPSLNNNYSDPSLMRGMDTFLSRVTSMMPQGPNFTAKTLSASDCVDVFSSPVVSEYRSLAVVFNITEGPDIFSFYETYGNGTSQPWTCYEDSAWTGEAPQSYWNYMFSCIDEMTDSAFTQAVAYASWDSDCNITDWNPHSCLAEPVSGSCELALSQPLLIYVILSNAIKALTLIYTISFLEFEPVITVGDAIRTFLDRPDVHSLGLGPVTSASVRNAHERYQFFIADRDVDANRKFVVARCKKARKTPWMAERKRLFSAAQRTRWFLAEGFFLMLEVAAIFPTAFQKTSDWFNTSKQLGLGGLSSNFFDTIAGTLTGLSILSNLPQVVASLGYFSFYSHLCLLYSTTELADFSKRRQSLRVSPPQRGSQRGSYSLSIPMYVALPFLIATTAIHWLISESLFIVRLNRIGPDGFADPKTHGGYHVGDAAPEHDNDADVIFYNVMNGLGFSPIAMVIAMVIAGALMIAPLLLGLRRLPSNAPILGYNSIALAAACQPDVADPTDVAEKQLMYGVLRTRGKTGKRRIGFSSLEVEPLVEGEIYEATKCLRKVLCPIKAYDCCAESEALDDDLGSSDHSSNGSNDESAHGKKATRSSSLSASLPESQSWTGRESTESRSYTYEPATDVASQSEESLLVAEDQHSTLTEPLREPSFDLGDGLYHRPEYRESYQIETLTLLTRANSRRELTLDNW